MRTIAESLTELSLLKVELRGAINEKGGELSGATPFGDYPQAIRDLPSGGPSVTGTSMASGVAMENITRGDSVVRAYFTNPLANQYDVVPAIFKTGGGDIKYVSYSQDGLRAAVARSASPYLYLYKKIDGIWTAQTLSANPTTYSLYGAWSPNGKIFLVTTVVDGSDAAFVYIDNFNNTFTRTGLSAFSYYRVKEVLAHPAGYFLIKYQDANYGSIYVRTLQINEDNSLTASNAIVCSYNLDQMAINPDGSRIAIIHSSDTRVNILQKTAGSISIISYFNIPFTANNNHFLRWTKDGTKILIGGGTTSLYVADVTGDTYTLNVTPITAPYTLYPPVIASSDNQWIMFRVSGGFVIVENTIGGFVFRLHVPVGGNLYSLTFTPDTTLLTYTTSTSPYVFNYKFVPESRLFKAHNLLSYANGFVVDAGYAESDIAVGDVGEIVSIFRVM